MHGLYANMVAAKEDHVCLKYATYARKLVEEAFDWS